MEPIMKTYEYRHADPLPPMFGADGRRHRAAAAPLFGKGHGGGAFR